MPDTPSTGNPVFDYRGAFRRSAAAWQVRMQFFGVILFALGGTLLLFNRHRACPLNPWAGIAALLGLGLLLAGCVWGVCWRQKIRREFREIYGLKNN
jgi:hypothetical protein